MRGKRIHPCRCAFVPPHVLENLARRGVEQARLSLRQSAESRAKRVSKSREVMGPTVAAVAGQSRREVYDCQSKWQQRVKRVRKEGDGPTGDAAADEVYDFAGQVRDYFQNVLGRNSVNDQGMDLILNVHFGVNYMNAFWDGDEMTFGDGDGVRFVMMTRSLDVVAHELAHGVTQFTANLDYYSQSGALNEHFSDVFGAAITQHVGGQKAGEADWLIGNEIMGPDLYGEALRSMRAPGQAHDNPLMGRDPQPDHMNNYYHGPADNRGVHINSGIPNKAFYLVSQDIGTDKATLIWYAALQKLWSTAVFNDAVDVLVESARELVRDGKAPLGSPQHVRAAFKEVGLPQ